jgi:hypothetical protein
MKMDRMTLVFFCVPFFVFCVENHGTDVGVLVFSIGTEWGIEWGILKPDDY